MNKNYNEKKLYKKFTLRYRIYSYHLNLNTKGFIIFVLQLQIIITHQYT